MDYFPLKIIKTGELDPSKNYMMGSHPHGVAGTGILIAIGLCPDVIHSLFPGIHFKLLTLRTFYFIPGLRELALLTGKKEVSRSLVTITAEFEMLTNNEP